MVTPHSVISRYYLIGHRLLMVLIVPLLLVLLPGTTTIANTPISRAILFPTLPVGREIRSYTVTSDGRYVLYVSDQDQDDVFELFRVSTTGGESKKLNSTLDVDDDVFSVMLTPNGKRVIFSEGDYSIGGYRVKSVSIEGGEPVDLKIQLKLGERIDPSFISLDSQWYVYTISSRTDSLPFSWTKMLYSVPTSATSSPTRLISVTSETQTISRIKLSSDSKNVVYTTGEWPESKYDLYSIPIEGGTSIKLNNIDPSEEHVHNMYLTPDGQRVLYLMAKTANLYSVGIEGGQSTRIGAYVYDYIEFNQTGSHVIYPSRVVSNNVDVIGFQFFYAPVKGGSSISLASVTATEPEKAELVAYAYTGKTDQVVYMVRRSSTNNKDIYLFSVATTGGDPVPISNRIGEWSNFNISSDGNWVLYDDEDSDGNWVLYDDEDGFSGLEQAFYSTPITANLPITLFATINRSGELYDYHLLDSTNIIYPHNFRVFTVDIQGGESRQLSLETFDTGNMSMNRVGPFMMNKQICIVYTFDLSSPTIRKSLHSTCFEGNFPQFSYLPVVQR